MIYNMSIFVNFHFFHTRALDLGWGTFWTPWNIPRTWWKNWVPGVFWSIMTQSIKKCQNWSFLTICSKQVLSCSTSWIPSNYKPICNYSRCKIYSRDISEALCTLWLCKVGYFHSWYCKYSKKKWWISWSSLSTYTISRRLLFTICPWQYLSSWRRTYRGRDIISYPWEPDRVFMT